MSAQSTPDVQPQRDTGAGGSQDTGGPTGSSVASTSPPMAGCDAKRYSALEVIGRGCNGVVCSALDRVTGEQVAIKQIKNVFDNVADATRILREIKLLRLLQHPDVVEFRHILLPADRRHFKDIYVVLERMESDLSIVVNANDNFTHDHHKVFLYQLLRGVNYMHHSGVLHGDLKPRNILANSNCKLKICDFGLARPFIADKPGTPVFWTDDVATWWYCAPELCGCFYGRYSHAVDIFSIGCIFAEILLGRPLFRGRDTVSQLHLITDLLGKPSKEVTDRISNAKARAFLAALPPHEERDFQTVFAGAHPDALALLKKLLAFEPTARPSAAEALADPYFKGLPDATFQNAAVDVASQFEFEHHRLSEEDVRELIYQEILHYHPGCEATARDSAGLAASGSTEVGSDSGMKKQCMGAEQAAVQQLQ